MSEQPYPEGTRCVITWVPAIVTASWVHLGAVVLCGNGAHCARTGLASNFIVGWEHPLGYPVAWMRPLEDPDAETIEDEQEVVA